MIQINNSYIKYLFFLLPLSLVTGPLIPEIIVFFVIINFFLTHLNEMLAMFLKIIFLNYLLLFHYLL